MKSVLIVHPQFRQIGGAEIVALQIIKRIQDVFDAHITILSLEPWSLSDINQQTGILLSPGRITVLVADYPKVLKTLPDRFYLLRIAFLHRKAKSFAQKYDLCVSTYNEIDFHKSGIQYIHHPSFASISSLKRHEMINDPYPLFVIKRVLELPYRIIVQLISGNSNNGFRMNFTMTNSQFMADWFKELYHCSATVVYPEATFTTLMNESEPWEKREFRFVTVGRISPDKKLLEYLDICKAILKVYPNAKFAIIGRVFDLAYYKKLQEKIERLSLPINLYHGLDRKALMRVLMSSKFYIAPKKYEHYGISVLEAARVGCLPFVHNSGGQREIVKNDLLMYDSIDQLLERISILVNDSILREKVLLELMEHIQMFNAANFNSEVDRIVRLCLDVT
jgi:glycosyltransferase involved in cell wall biosynthesis